MAINTYFDKKLGHECFKVRIVKKSSEKSNVSVDKILFGFKTRAEAEKAERKLLTDVQRELFSLE